MPRSVIVAPPSLVTLPPSVAETWVTAVCVGVVTVGAAGSVENAATGDVYVVPRQLVAEAASEYAATGVRLATPVAKTPVVPVAVTVVSHEPPLFAFPSAYGTE